MPYKNQTTSPIIAAPSSKLAGWFRLEEAATYGALFITFIFIFILLSAIRYYGTYKSCLIYPYRSGKNSMAVNILIPISYLIGLIFNFMVLHQTVLSGKLAVRYIPSLFISTITYFMIYIHMIVADIQYSMQKRAAHVHLKRYFAFLLGLAPAGAAMCLATVHTRSLLIAVLFIAELVIRSLVSFFMLSYASAVTIRLEERKNMLWSSVPIPEPIQRTLTISENSYQDSAEYLNP